jgi:hypothetical protein
VVVCVLDFVLVEENYNTGRKGREAGDVVINCSLKAYTLSLGIYAIIKDLRSQS